jgi:autotransporter-associated beta strand protein
MFTHSLHSRRRALCSSIAAVIVGAGVVPGKAATFTWNTASGNWSLGTNWVGNTAPTGANPLDILVFGGNVAAPYTSTNNIGTVPFRLNQLVLQATDPGLTGNDNFIVGNGIQLGGTSPAILENGANFTIDTPIELTATTTFGGTSTGTVTMNYAVTGVADIVKTGPGVFRFGTPFSSPTTGPSANTWFGTLSINQGTFRFNNNAEAAPTALRSNPVVMSAGGTLLFASKVTDQESSARMGTVSGTGGLVQARGQLSGGSQDSLDIGIYAFRDGDFAGTIQNTRVGTQSGGHATGVLIIRGTATQTFSGTMDIEKDILVGGTATLRLTGAASLNGQSTGAIVMEGGTLLLDNVTTNNTSRLRDGTASSSGLDVIGGGMFSLVGNAAGSTETIARLQLGSSTKPRSGALNLNVSPKNGATGATALTLQSYQRDQASNPSVTVNFSARNESGTALTLGLSGSNPRILFNSSVPLYNGLLGNTGLGDTTTVGWATVNGTDFATYNLATGITAVAIDATPAVSGTGNAASNILMTGSATLSNASGYSVNSLKLAPITSGQTLNIGSAGNLTTGAILLAGSTDYTIDATNLGGIANVGGTGPRYFHVQQAALTVNASLAVTPGSPVVKAGDGLLILNHVNNVGITAPLYINAGIVRAKPGTTLPGGELRFRGGVLEITGGGTFLRTIGNGSGKVTWSGVDGSGLNIAEERGSGGFAAVGADVTVDLNGAGPTLISWEDVGFVDSGFALIFGSKNATAKVTFVDNINLTQAVPNGALNYNAREIRVTDNPGSANDLAVMSGVISGNIQTDLLKTGAGTLQLTGANTYGGNTLIQGGVLSISAANGLGATSGSNVVSINGATLRDTGAGVVLPSGRSVAVGTNGATLDVTTGADMTISGAVAGAGAALVKTGAGTLKLNGDQKYGTLTTSAGVTTIGGTFTSTGATVNANATTNFTTSETLGALNIGAGAVVTFGTVAGPLAFEAVVPEPSSIALAAMGAAVIGFRRRRA